MNEIDEDVIEDVEEELDAEAEVYGGQLVDYMAREVVRLQNQVPLPSQTLDEFRKDQLEQLGMNLLNVLDGGEVDLPNFVITVVDEDEDKEDVVITGFSSRWQSRLDHLKSTYVKGD